MGLKPLLGVFVILLVLTTIGLNIYNLVICARALSEQKCGKKEKGGGGVGVGVNVFETAVNGGGGRLKKYLIGSMVCSGASIATGGVFPPIPHLVFAILGQSTWHLQDARPCGDATPSALAHNIHQSLIVLWFTIAASVMLICLTQSCSLGCDSCFGVEVDTGKGFSVSVP